MAKGNKVGRMFILESVHHHLHHYFLSISVADVTRSNKLLSLYIIGWVILVPLGFITFSNHVSQQHMTFIEVSLWHVLIIPVWKVTNILFHPVHLLTTIYLIWCIVMFMVLLLLCQGCDISTLSYLLIIYLDTYGCFFIRSKFEFPTLIMNFHQVCVYTIS